MEQRQRLCIVCDSIVHIRQIFSERSLAVALSVTVIHVAHDKGGRARALTIGPDGRLCCGGVFGNTAERKQVAN